MTRRKLPTRRPSMTWKVKRPVSFSEPASGSTSFYLTIGFDPETGAASECFFAGGFRSGSDLEFLVCDACIVVSVALQNGVTAAHMGRSMTRRELPDGTLADASLLALILRAVATAEVEMDAVREAMTSEEARPDDAPRYGDAAE